VSVLQPDRLRDDGFLGTFAQYELDLAVVAAYGKILPAQLLALPRQGMINVHASLLPRWRGAAPVHRAILAGDAETGVTIMRVVPALDAGPILSRAAVAIDPNETSVELERRLAEAGARLLVETVDALAAGPLREEPQSAEGVTYAARLERTESAVDWSQPSRTVHNRIRGLQPWPMATVTFHGRRLRLLRSEVASDVAQPAAAGTVTDVSPAGLVVATRPGTVRLTRIQLEGRPPASIRDFLNGHVVKVGESLVSGTAAV
jgi:methionyl-tRNA formyltransferase